MEEEGSRYVPYNFSGCVEEEQTISNEVSHM